MEQQLRLGALLFVGGAGGVGKTKLAREVARRARSRGWSVTGLPGGIRPDVPFGLVGEVAAQVEASLGATDRFPPPRRSGSRRPGTLVVVDDAHRLDEGRAAALGRLARAGGAAVLATVSTDELDPLPAHLTTLAHSADARWLDLYSLPAQELATLLTSVLGAPCEEGTLHQLLSAYNGNLPFLRELVIAGYEDGRLRLEHDRYHWRGSFAPVGALAAMVDTRLGRLRADRRDAVELLALAGQLELHVVQEFMAAQDLAAVERSGIIVLTRSRCRFTVSFSTPLFRERVLGLMPPLRRSGHQRRLAELVQALPSRRPGDLARAVSCQLEARVAVPAGRLLAAAEERWRCYQFQEALPLAQAAHDLEHSVASTVLLGQILAALGRAQEAEQVLGMAEPETLAWADRLEWRLARAANLAFGLYRARAAVELLAKDPDASADPRWRAERAGLRAAIAYATGSPAAASQILEQAGGRDLDRRPPTDYDWVLVFAATDRGRPEAALAEAARLQRLTTPSQEGHPRLLAEVEFGRWRALERLGRIEEAEQLATSSYQAAVLTADSDLQRVWSVAAGVTALRRGRVRTAIQQLSMGLDPNRPLPLFLDFACRRALAEAGAQVGDRELAPEPPVPADGGPSAPATLWIQGWRQVGAGELARARESFGAVAQHAAERGCVMHELEALDALVRIGAVRLAGRRLSAVAALVDGEWARLVAGRAEALRRSDAAALAAIADGYARSGMLLAAAETACFAAEQHRRSQQAELARREAVRAAAWHANCEGALSPAFAALAGGGHVLTAREWQIATLAASGLTSSAIAAQLVLSVRTVESHLYNCYAKLGAHGRADLAGIFGPSS